jgi:hypothetical protein
MKYLYDWDKICLPAIGKIQNNGDIIEVIVISNPTMLKNEILYYEVDNPLGYKITNLNNLYSIDEKDNDNNISIQS